jgi:hypothetical protein
LRLKLKTKTRELCALLDYVFESAQEPDFAYVQELAFRCSNPLWVMAELLRLMWLCSEDQAAFDEEIWRLTNEA